MDNLLHERGEQAHPSPELSPASDDSLDDTSSDTQQSGILRALSSPPAPQSLPTSTHHPEQLSSTTAQKRRNQPPWRQSLVERSYAEQDHAPRSVQQAAPEGPKSDTSSAGRPRKTSLLRKSGKTGCLNCRESRIECDEKRPICTNCIESTRNCIWNESTFSSEARAGLRSDPYLLTDRARAYRGLTTTKFDDTGYHDGDFWLRGRGFFSVGRVFSVLWAQPAGESNKPSTSFGLISEISHGRFGERLLSRVQRFVVVRAAEHYASALPIMNYGQCGVSRSGVARHEHSVIYTGTEPPNPLPDEVAAHAGRPMRFRAIRVVPDDESTDRLDALSRLDFGRVSTITHNIKAMSFGMVHPASMQALVEQFASVWRDSIVAPSATTLETGSSPVLAMSLSEVQEMEAIRLESQARLQQYGRQLHRIQAESEAHVVSGLLPRHLQQHEKAAKAQQDIEMPEGDKMDEYDASPNLQPPAQPLPFDRANVQVPRIEVDAIQGAEQLTANSMHQHDGLAREQLSTEAKTLLPDNSTVCSLSPETQNASRFRSFTALTMELRNGISGSLTHVRYQLAWDPFAFLEWNFPEQGRSQNVMDVLTVTHSRNREFQALTCSQYLRQTWPDSGPIFSALFGDLLKRVGQTSQLQTAYQRPLHLTLRVEADTVIVYVSGLRAEVIEVGEQLAWLGAACRVPKRDDGGLSSVYIQPTISRQPMRTEDNAGAPSFLVDYDQTSKGYPQDGNLEGGCWLSLFQELCIVDGFPTATREDGAKGIEIPLDIMVTLGETKTLTTFHGRLLLKGPTTMFVATFLTPNFVNWHLLATNDGSEVPYDAVFKIEKSSAPDIECLSVARHFVGWAKHVDINFGTRNAAYNIAHANPGTIMSSRIELHSVSVALGKDNGASATFVRGRRERLQAPAQTYSQKLDALPWELIVVYDDCARRAWLVDAARTLLHLLRCSIRSNYKDSTLIEDDDCEYAQTDPRIAVTEVLKRPKFAARVLQEDSSTPKRIIETVNGVITTREVQETIQWAVRDEVLRIYDMLQRVFAHRRHRQSKSSIGLRGTARERVEGWSFLDLACFGGNIQPRAAYLRPEARAWVKFSKAIDATILLGSNFGDIITPRDTADICTHWQRVPENQDCLTTPMHLLQQVYDKYGSTTSEGIIELARKLCWHQSGHLFDKCTCAVAQVQPSCHRIQDMYRRARVGSTVRSPHNSVFENHPDGAVIFARLSIVARCSVPSIQDSPQSSAAASGESGAGTAASTSLPASRGMSRFRSRVTTLLDPA